MSKIDDIREQERKHREEHWTPVHWRAWGSWFSWGSPVGLGLFFLILAAAFWVVMQAI